MIVHFYQKGYNSLQNAMSHSRNVMCLFFISSKIYQTTLLLSIFQTFMFF